jgi:hypothetical protein
MAMESTKTQRKMVDVAVKAHFIAFDAGALP